MPQLMPLNWFLSFFMVYFLLMMFIFMYIEEMGKLNNNNNYLNTGFSKINNFVLWKW